MKALAIATERQRHPERSDEENYKHAMARWMRASEWEPELRKGIFGF
jgi:succinate dehydrogenase/fumarate reductase flavoprotein subunit